MKIDKTKIQKIILDGGKYTIIYDETNSFPEKCLRYGEDWRDLVGDNLIFYLCNKIKELKEKIDEFENEIGNIQKITLNDETNSCQYFKNKADVIEIPCGCKDCAHWDERGYGWIQR